MYQGDRGTVIKGDSGAIAVGGGTRTGPGGNTIGGAGAVAVGKGPGGTTVAKGKSAVGVSNGMSSRVAVRGGAAVRGPGGNTISGGYGGAFVNGQFVGGASWSAVNGNFTRWNSFTPGWRAGYPGAWWPGKWTARAAWATATWGVAGAYCGCSGDGAYYDYGDEGVSYAEDGSVYYGEEPVATAEEYYEQAGDIAAAGETTTNEEWLSLGVFAAVTEGQTQTDKTVQLAVNKQGVIRGNLHDQLADKVSPITGSVDKSTQRVAMRIEGNDKVIVETGLYNLTNDEVPVLIHFDKDRQESRLLVRLEPPADAAEAK